MSENVVEVTDSTFDVEVLKSSIPVLVDFWAPWCGPCRAVAPTLEEVAKEFSGKIKVAKINVDHNPQAPSRYQVRSIPNLVLIKNGELQEQIIGNVAKQELFAAVNRVL